MSLTRTRILKWAAAGAVATAALFAASAASAQVSWSVGVSTPGVVVGVGGPGYYAPPPPVYYAPPPPVYYRPAPVYYAPPPPVYYRAPRYYGPRYYGPPRGYHRHHHGHWR